MRDSLIRAGRLTLRPFTTDDIAWVYEVSQDSDLRRWVELPSPYRWENAAYFVEHLAIEGRESGQRMEFLAEDDGVRSGRVGVWLGTNGIAEVGYWVDPRARGRGVATASVRAACEWAFATFGLEIIEWRCEVGNTASRRVAEKAGFVVEGTLRRRLFHRGRRVDAWVGSMTRDELGDGFASS
ncbi:GNAT family N-acetyltransferase [Nonomuraea sp. NPDC049419]|uniref:GNAT family N-acetyltransferase n=1 Tax=Nonomuraea sp. NPDC049419 TaxID=3155772 RepID=UPI0034392569